MHYNSLLDNNKRLSANAEDKAITF